MQWKQKILLFFFCPYQWFLFVILKSLRDTCNLLPLDKKLCLSSCARRWPSFCQVMLGDGVPLETQSITAILFPSTFTSSGRSPSAPLMDGGTTKEQHTVRMLWFSISLWNSKISECLQKQIVKLSVNTLKDIKIPRIVQWMNQGDCRRSMFIHSRHKEEGKTYLPTRQSSSLTPE